MASPFRIQRTLIALVWLAVATIASTPFTTNAAQQNELRSTNSTFQRPTGAPQVESENLYAANTENGSLQQRHLTGQFNSGDVQQQSAQRHWQAPPQSTAATAVSTPPPRDYNTQPNVAPAMTVPATFQTAHQPQVTDSQVQPASASLGDERNNRVTAASNMVEEMERSLGNARPNARVAEQNDFSSFGRDLAETPPRSDSSTTNKLELRKQDELSAMMQKMATSTLIVMACGIAFILAAKIWLKNGDSTNAGKPEREIGFRMISKMKLGPKADLMLVEIENQRMVVATDPTGVKSVVHLTESFSSKLDAIERDMATAGELPNSKRELRVDEDTSGGAEPRGMTYSLGSIGRNRQQRSRSGAESPAASKIESDLEAALADTGLKDLILRSLKTQS